jgi:hypothetical protein
MLTAHSYIPKQNMPELFSFASLPEKGTIYNEMI